MKNLIKYAMMVLLGIAIVIGCSESEKAEQQPAVQEEVAPAEETIDLTADMLTTNVDLVCGMDMSKHAIKDTTVYKDQLYGFCSDHCKMKFTEDPETFVAKLEKQ